MKKIVLFILLIVLFNFTLVSCNNAEQVTDRLVPYAEEGLERFHSAQTPEVLAAVEMELGNGKKTNHWIWFIFPQIDGLGSSSTSKRYAIKSRVEATAYLADSFLHDNLIRHVRLVLSHHGTKTLNEIFGSVDEQKFVSSMTLFSLVSSDSIFADTLRAFGKSPDSRTVQLAK
jgi:uncharacterized protein (DUF1810 family)